MDTCREVTEVTSAPAWGPVYGPAKVGLDHSSETYRPIPGSGKIKGHGWVKQAKGRNAPCTECPTSWDRIKTGWHHAGQIWQDLLGISKIPSVQDIAQIIIVGKGGGTEQFALKNMGHGKIGVWDLNDKNSIMSILDFTISDKLLDVGNGFIGLYYDNPLNDWHGYFFDRTMNWTPSERYPGYYFNTTGNSNFSGYYYSYH